jgi:hypothetical protein
LSIHDALRSFSIRTFVAEMTTTMKFTSFYWTVIDLILLPLIIFCNWVFQNKNRFDCNEAVFWMKSIKQSVLLFNILSLNTCYYR